MLSNAFDLSYVEMENAGNFVIALVVLFIVFNMVIMVYDVCKFLRIYLKRMRDIIDHRCTRLTIQ